LAVARCIKIPEELKAHVWPCVHIQLHPDYFMGALLVFFQTPQPTVVDGQQDWTGIWAMVFKIQEEAHKYL